MFTVYMKMEDGTKLVWEGTADEIRKQAIAEIQQFKKDHFHFIHIK